MFKLADAITTQFNYDEVYELNSYLYAWLNKLPDIIHFEKEEFDKTV